MRVHGETHEGTQQVNDDRVDDDDKDDDEVEDDDPNWVHQQSFSFCGTAVCVSLCVKSVALGQSAVMTLSL